MHLSSSVYVRIHVQHDRKRNSTHTVDTCRGQFTPEMLVLYSEVFAQLEFSARACVGGDNHGFCVIADLDSSTCKWVHAKTYTCPQAKIPQGIAAAYSVVFLEMVVYT